MEAKIKEIIGSILDVKPEDLSENSEPDSIENWDSVNHMHIITALEDEFDLLLTEEEIIEMLSISKIIEMIENKL